MYGALYIFLKGELSYLTFNTKNIIRFYETLNHF